MAETPKTFLKLCTAYSLILFQGNKALIIPIVMTFSGTIQKLYRIVAGSAKKSNILVKHIPKMTLQSLQAQNRNATKVKDCI